MKERAIIVDMDGTLALMGERSPFQWHRVGEDVPNTPVIECVQAMRAAGYEILVTSGRDEVCRAGTARWLMIFLGFVPTLYMRKTRDNRKDFIVKEEIYRNDIEPYYDVAFVLDDRQQVVDLWRSIGLACFQVAPSPD